MDASHAGLAAATALHAGFQLAVTVLVYPALAAVPSESWCDRHAAHSRRITPLVAVVYAGLVAACAGVLLDEPSAVQALSVVASGVSLGITATVAAPAHRLLGRSADPGVLRRLIVADRVRCSAAVVAAALALLGATAAG